MFDYFIGSMLIVLIFSVISLGLNFQWGYTGLFNIGVAGFFAIGAYTAALITIKPALPSQFEDYHFTGNLQNIFDGIPIINTLDLWFFIAFLAAMIISGIIALPIGLITLRLRDDYLAIATLGVGESIRMIFLNERWLGNGSKGLYTIPRVYGDIVSPENYDFIYLGVVVAITILLYISAYRLLHSPWGRTLRAIKNDEVAAASLGKNIVRFKLEAFIIGAMIMGGGGALFVFNLRAISPLTFTPLLGTFLIWAMLIVGGSGKFFGPIIGALVVWTIWSGTQFLPGNLSSPATRFLMIGLLITASIVFNPEGIAGLINKKIAKVSHK